MSTSLPGRALLRFIGVARRVRDDPRSIPPRIWKRISPRHRRTTADERDRASIPTMLARAEQAMLYEYAARAYEGRGAIVELGCWLGGGSVPLAQGLMLNPRGPTKSSVVHAYDNFEWTPQLAHDYRGTPLAFLRAGDSCLSEYTKHTARWSHRIRVHAGDLNQLGWIGQPIELLFIDAMKSWDLATTIVREFFRALQPGATVVHQDFIHWNTPWILLLAHRFRDWLQPYEWIPSTSSYIFRCVSPPPVDALRGPFRFNSWSEREVDEAFAFCMELVPRWARANLMAARVTYDIYAGRLDRAAAELEHVEAELAHVAEKQWPDESDVRFVRPRLHQVMAIRELLRRDGPTRISDVAKACALLAADVRAALGELETYGMVRSAPEMPDQYVVTARGHAWIDRAFDRFALTSSPEG